MGRHFVAVRRGCFPVLLTVAAELLTKTAVRCSVPRSSSRSEDCVDPSNQTTRDKTKMAVYADDPGKIRLNSAQDDTSSARVFVRGRRVARPGDRCDPARGPVR